MVVTRMTRILTTPFISYLRYSRPVTEDYLGRIGNLIRDARKHRGWTQQQLSEMLGTSQSAVNRIERGHQNLSLDMLARIGEALDSPLVSIGQGPTHLRVAGPTTLSGPRGEYSIRGVALLWPPVNPAVRRCAGARMRFNRLLGAVRSHRSWWLPRNAL